MVRCVTNPVLRRRLRLAGTEDLCSCGEWFEREENGDDHCVDCKTKLYSARLRYIIYMESRGIRVCKSQ